MFRIPITPALFALALLMPSLATAQSSRTRYTPTPPRPEEPVQFDRDDLSGPRFGLTYVVGDGRIASRLAENDMERALSQFGWHFERRVTPRGGGPQFVVEAVPMISGVEYGTVIPNVTLAMGVRFPSGWEFGIGPNVIATGFEDEDDIQTSLVTAVGYSFQYSGVSLPVNLAVANSPEGSRISLIIGYAIRR